MQAGIKPNLLTEKNHSINKSLRGCVASEAISKKTETPRIIDSILGKYVKPTSPLTQIIDKFLRGCLIEAV